MTSRVWVTVKGACLILVSRRREKRSKQHHISKSIKFCGAGVMIPAPDRGLELAVRAALLWLPSGILRYWCAGISARRSRRLISAAGTELFGNCRCLEDLDFANTTRSFCSIPLSPQGEATTPYSCLTAVASRQPQSPPSFCIASQSLSRPRPRPLIPLGVDNIGGLNNQRMYSDLLHRVVSTTTDRLFILQVLLLCLTFNLQRLWPIES